MAGRGWNQSGGRSAHPFCPMDGHPPSAMLRLWERTNNEDRRRSWLSPLRRRLCWMNQATAAATAARSIDDAEVRTRANLPTRLR
jgi:hypothetical protein